jgi:glycosyltransferase involved in cell wall biosynthesis
MKISFVVPAYNEEDRIAGCLESILAELKCTPADAEIIVVNNASTDRTKEVAQGFAGVRVIDESKKGLVRARQAGYVASSGDIIANIDSDVMLTPGWLKFVLDAFEKDKNLVCLSGPFIMHDVSPFLRFWVSFWYGISYAMHFILHGVFGAGAVAQGGNYTLRRSALDAIGGFDTSIEFYGEDTDIARRISKLGKAVWTFRLPVYSSGRRLAHEGVITTAFRYSVNFIWMTLIGRPYSQQYSDIRPSQVSDKKVK